MPHGAELDYRTLVEEFLRTQDDWRGQLEADSWVLSGTAMHHFCRWLVRTGRATEDEVRDLKQRVVRVYERPGRYVTEEG